MQPLTLVLVVHDATPPARSALETAALIEDAWIPLLDLLEEHPGMRVGLSLSAGLSRALDRDMPALLDRLQALSKRGQVELLAGSGSGAPPQVLPRADGSRHLVRQRDWLRSRLRTPIRGAWLPYGAWDPGLPQLLGHAGLVYSFIDQRLVVAAGENPTDLCGPVRVEHLGTSLRLLLLDRGLSRSALQAPERLVGALRLHGEAARRLHAIALPLEAIDRDRLGALVRRLSQESSWLRTLVPWQAVDRLPDAGRVTPLAGLPLAGAAARLAPLPARRLLGDASPWAAGPPWEAVLSRFDGADRLHRCMIRTSALVQALGRRSARRDPALKSAWEEADELLLRGQAGAPLEPGPGGALWDPAERAAAWTCLHRAEALASKHLGEPPCAVSYGEERQQGLAPDEVQVRTPHLSAIIDAGRGGALSELVLWGEHELVNTLERHARLDLPETSPDLPVLLDEDPFDLASDPTDEISSSFASRARPAAVLDEDAVAVDRLPRLSFQDRMFGQPLTLSNLRRSQPPEIGDFACGPYRVVQAGTDAEGVEVVLSREGTVRPLPGQEGLVQVMKTWRFSAREATATVRYVLSNRSREPVRCSFGVSVNLNLDGLTGASRVLRVPRRPPLPVDASVEIPETDGAALIFADHRFNIVLRASIAGRLYVFPVEIPPPPPADAELPPLRPFEPSPFQGTCLVFAWPMDLWGEERRQIELSLKAGRK